MIKRALISVFDKTGIVEFAKELNKRLDYVTINAPLNKNHFKINYYFPYNAFKEKSKNLDIAWFTHVEEYSESEKRIFFENAKKLNFCVCHSKKYEKILRDKGVKNVVTINPGVDLGSFKPKLILGFIGRFYSYSKRKGENLISQIKTIPFVELRCTEGKIPESEMPNFYRQLDYVLIASKYEGGPMCLVEGLACGVHIIAPKDVGMVSEFEKGIYHYKNSDFESLKNLLEKLYKKKLELREQVEHMTWDKFAEEHDKLFKRLIGEKEVEENI